MDFFMLVIIQTVVFAVWVVVMFITLFGQRARVQAKTGKAFPGVGDALADWKHWWRSPDHRGQRVLLMTLTVLLLGLIALSAALLPTEV